MTEVILNVELVLLAIGTTLFPIAYHVRSGGDWRRTPMGRHLMGYTTAAALLSLSGIVRVFLPDLPGQELTRIGVLLLALVFVYQRDYILFRVQHDEDVPREERARS